MRAPDGGFHIKAAGLELGRLYFAVKTNANFPDNPRRHGLPAIQGVIVLCDADDGRPLAVMDSIEVTIRRTAAATAVAAKYLARPDAGAVTICGCGSQGRAQLRALARVLPLRARLRVRRAMRPPRAPTPPRCRRSSASRSRRSRDLADGARATATCA